MTKRSIPTFRPGQTVESSEPALLASLITRNVVDGSDELITQVESGWWVCGLAPMHEGSRHAQG